MTKFATMTVRVPVDDALAVIRVRDHLQAALEQRGTESLPVPVNGGGEPELPDTPPAAGRIHWPATSVTLAAERPAPAARKPTANGRRPPT
ncbi:MAG TPA: hypothetical protein VK741_25815 [Acetobacteraceae bacterium]|jgi:hypothetical protein|nr:hypothetical protein [Acetobacteraceae bacterium]